MDTGSWVVRAVVGRSFDKQPSAEDFRANKPPQCARCNDAYLMHYLVCQGRVRSRQWASHVADILQ
jgi:hypothetical protein